MALGFALLNAWVTTLALAVAMLAAGTFILTRPARDFVVEPSTDDPL